MNIQPLVITWQAWNVGHTHTLDISTGGFTSVCVCECDLNPGLAMGSLVSDFRFLYLGKLQEAMILECFPQRWLPRPCDVEGHLVPPAIDAMLPAVIRDDPQSQHANAWLSWLYQFVAEDAADVEIPTEPKQPNGDLDIFENQAFVEEHIPLPAIADPLIDLPMSDGNGGKDLPSRYLPPGRIAELYDFYMTSSEHGHASKSTFARCFRAYWRHALMFRDRSHHSRCSLCSKYSRQRTLCMSAEDKEEVKAAHAAHVRSVLNDRATYMRAQRLCEESCKPADQPEQISKEDSVLTISIDGMDQASQLCCSTSACSVLVSCWFMSIGITSHCITRMCSECSHKQFPQWLSVCQLTPIGSYHSTCPSQLLRVNTVSAPLSRPALELTQTQLIVCIGG